MENPAREKTSKQIRTLLLTVAIAIGLGAIQPIFWNYVAGSAEKLQNTRTIEQQYENVKQKLDEAATSRDKQDQLLEQLSVVFPDKTDTSQIIERLEQLASQGYVFMDIKNINEGKPLETKSKNVQVIPLLLTLEIAGPPERVLSYIDAVEHTQELANVTNFSFEKVEDPAAYPSIPYTPGDTIYSVLNVQFYLRGK